MSGSGSYISEYFLSSTIFDTSIFLILFMLIFIVLFLGDPSPSIWPKVSNTYIRADYWKRSWCWERLMAKGEEGSRGWGGWTASVTQWTWVWASSRRQWRTGKPGLLQSTGSQRVGHNLVTEQQQQIEYIKYILLTKHWNKLPYKYYII